MRNEFRRYGEGYIEPGKRNLRTPVQMRCGFLPVPERVVTGPRITRPGPGQ